MDIYELIQQKCPNGAPVRKLSECCNILDSQRQPVTESQRESGEFPYYGASGVQDYVSDYIFDGVFVLVGEDGSAITEDGKPVVTWAEGKIWVNNHAHIVSEIADVSLRYLFYYLQTVDISAMVHGSIPKFTGRDFKNLKIPIPPLQIQREIVAILDKFDAYCNSITAGLAGELEMRRKQYRYWRNKIFQDLLDEGCETRKLKDVASIINGRDYKHLDEGNVPVYGSGGVMCSVSEVMYDGPSVLIPRKGSLRNLFYSEGPIWCVDTIFHTVIDDSIVNPKFLYYVVRWRNVEQLGSGGGVPGLTQRVLYKLDIPVPDMAQQREIVGILDKFCELERELERELELRRKQYGYYRDMLLAFPEQKGA